MPMHGDGIDDNVHLQFFPTHTPATNTPATPDVHASTKRRLDRQDEQLAELRMEWEGWKRQRLTSREDGQDREQDRAQEEVAALHQTLNELRMHMQELEDEKNEREERESEAVSEESGETIADAQEYTLDDGIFMTITELQDQLEDLKRDVGALKASRRVYGGVSAGEMMESVRRFDEDYRARIGHLQSLVEGERLATKRIEDVLEELAESERGASAKKTGNVKTNKQPKGILKKVTKEAAQSLLSSVASSDIGTASPPQKELL